MDTYVASAHTSDVNDTAVMLLRIKKYQLSARKHTLELLLSLLDSVPDVQTIGVVLQIALEEGVLTELAIASALLVERSTVNRWKNCVSDPGKRKRLILLELIRSRLPSSIREINEALAEWRQRYE